MRQVKKSPMHNDVLPVILEQMQSTKVMLNVKILTG